MVGKDDGRRLSHATLSSAACDSDATTAHAVPDALRVQCSGPLTHEMQTNP